MDNETVNPEELQLEDRVIEKGINRTAKVVKGGRRFSFSAIVVSGNRQGVIGYGFGKGREVPLAVQKATKAAHRDLKRISLKGDTIPHTIIGEYAASRVLLRPAGPGTGVIAGAAVRAVCELAGIRNILTKSFGRNNPINLVKATLQALESLRSKEEVESLRGVKIE